MVSLLKTIKSKNTSKIDYSIILETQQNMSSDDYYFLTRKNKTLKDYDQVSCPLFVFFVVNYSFLDII